MRNVKTSYGIVSAQKTENGYTVFTPCGCVAGSVEVYTSVNDKKIYYAGVLGGRNCKTLPEACNALLSHFYAERQKREIEAADADAQAAEQVESEQSAAFEDVVITKQCCAKNLIGEIFFVGVGDILFFDKEKQSFATKLFTEGEQQPDIIYISPAQADHVIGAQHPEPVAAPAPVAAPTPAKSIVGKADGSAEITTADGVTTIAPRNGERDELEVLQQQHGIEIMPIEFPANGVDSEYGIVQNDTEIGAIYFVEGAGYCPLYRSQRAGLIPASGMQPNIGDAIEKLMQKIKELGVPENAPKARRPLPEDLQNAQAELEKVDSLLRWATKRKVAYTPNTNRQNTHSITQIMKEETMAEAGYTLGAIQYATLKAAPIMERVTYALKEIAKLPVTKFADPEFSIDGADWRCRFHIPLEYMAFREMIHNAFGTYTFREGFANGLRYEIYSREVNSVVARIIVPSNFMPFEP